MLSDFIYLDFQIHRNGYDKGEHFAYPYFLTVFLSAFGWALQLPIHVVRVVMIGVAIICVLWEIGELLTGADKISVGDLLADALGIILGGLTILMFESWGGIS